MNNNILIETINEKVNKLINNHIDNNVTQVISGCNWSDPEVIETMTCTTQQACQQVPNILIDLRNEFIHTETNSN